VLTLVVGAALLAPATTSAAGVEHACSLDRDSRLSSLGADTATTCAAAQQVALAALESPTVALAGVTWSCERLGTTTMQCFGSPSGWIMFGLRSPDYPRQPGPRPLPDRRVAEARATPSGLAPGARSSWVTDVVPDADFGHGRWSLITAYSPIGDGGYYDVLAASVSGGRVTALTGWVGGADE
jgi:hypothetical protein